MNTTSMTMAQNIDDMAKDVKVSSGNDIQNDWVLVTQKEVNRKPKITKT